MHAEKLRSLVHLPVCPLRKNEEGGFDIVIQSQISDIEARDYPETATSSHQDEQVDGAVSQEIPSTVVDPEVEPTRMPERFLAHVRVVLFQEIEGLLLLQLFTLEFEAHFVELSSFMRERLRLPPQTPVPQC